MSRKKQIKEMVRELSEVWIVDWEGNPHELHEKLWGDDLENIAIELYNIGYRKQIEGEWKKVSDKSPRYKCTICNHLYNNMEYKYCPYCGAKMKGGAK